MGLFGRFEVHTAGGFPVTAGRYESLEAAQRRAKRLWGGGTVVDREAHTVGDQVVWGSDRYWSRFPRGSGGQRMGEAVEPPEDMFTPGARAAFERQRLDIHGRPK